MKRGTKSILFGVHQFLWHPFTVWRAWRYLYKENPGWVYWICIFVHDLGYWGKPDMDGVDGRTHPEGGAKIAQWIVYWANRLRGESKRDCQLFAETAHDICLCHSTHYAQLKGLSVSTLYLPDKVCILFDPPWFYKLRAWLSGELAEYVDRENHARWVFGQDKLTSDQWLMGYRARNQKKADEFLQKEYLRKRKDMIWLLHRALTPGKCECDICIERKTSRASN